VLEIEDEQIVEKGSWFVKLTKAKAIRLALRNEAIVRCPFQRTLCHLSFSSCFCAADSTMASQNESIPSSLHRPYRIVGP